MVGQKKTNVINVEGDFCYNNPLFERRRHAFSSWHHCLIASRLSRASGKYVDLPNHKGIYTANMAKN